MSHNVHRFVFLHGGPGFNTFAEEALLRPLFEPTGNEIEFWNEPSRLRPDGEAFEAEHAFERWVTSATRFVLHSAARQPVHVITHSFAVHAALEIARRHSSRIASLVLLAPCVDAFPTFANVLRVAQGDLVGAKPDAAAAIAQCLGRTRAVFDDAMREGLMNALHDDRRFTHYWADARQFEVSVAALARSEAQFDGESFFGVLGDFGRRGTTLLSSADVTVPTLALFGAVDPITSADEQRQAVTTAVPGVRIEVLDGCSHYLHLDRPQHFVDLVVDWATANSRDRVQRS